MLRFLFRYTRAVRSGAMSWYLVHRVLGMYNGITQYVKPTKAS